MVTVHTYTHNEAFLLESGKVLPQIELAYVAYGNRAADDSNVVWFCHSLTSDAQVQNWWAALVGEGKLFDPAKYFIVCANYIGSCYGSTGPLSVNPLTNEPYYYDFPEITTRDLANSLDLLRHHLGINKVHTLVGGSLGGQVALEWSVSQPEAFEHVFILAANAKNSPWAIALNETQRMAIQADQTWGERTPDAGMAGLRTARAIAVMSYRSYETYAKTQADHDNNLINGFRAISYQNYQGDKFTKRFNAYSYWILSKVMDSHNVGRNREGGVEGALKRIKGHVLVLGIDSDLLFPKHESKYMSQYLSNAHYYEMNSLYGHDSFLIDFPQLDKVIKHFYEKVQKSAKVLPLISYLKQAIAAMF